MSTPNTEVLGFEYGALFTIHQSLRFSDSVIKKDFKYVTSFSEQKYIIHPRWK